MQRKMMAYHLVDQSNGRGHDRLRGYQVSAIVLLTEFIVCFLAVCIGVCFAASKSLDVDLAPEKTAWFVLVPSLSQSGVFSIWNCSTEVKDVSVSDYGYPINVATITSHLYFRWRLRLELSQELLDEHSEATARVVDEDLSSKQIVLKGEALDYLQRAALSEVWFMVPVDQSCLTNRVATGERFLYCHLDALRAFYGKNVCIDSPVTTMSAPTQFREVNPSVLIVRAITRNRIKQCHSNFIEGFLRMRNLNRPDVRAALMPAASLEDNWKAYLKTFGCSVLNIRVNLDLNYVLFEAPADTASILIGMTGQKHRIGPWTIRQPDKATPVSDDDDPFARSREGGGEGGGKAGSSISRPPGVPPDNS